MPLYEYRCRMCDWKRERRAGLYVDAIPCEACGETAFRNPINRFNVTYPQFYGGELPREIDEAKEQYKRSLFAARDAWNAEVASGWEPGDLKS